ncbi:hypothetical protein [Salinispora oceanensis]|uniref:hypothetical protein n=1 Tax=Salinispora oceanensis TaxID=1050199 RepID=UPI0013A58C0C|nr:hypothetical protein [Salinispora oceanensis]
MSVDRPLPRHALPAPAATFGVASAAAKDASAVELSAAECRAALEVLHRDEYADMSVAQVWARDLDSGRYWCSQSTMYRVLREAGQSRERRR